MPDTQELIQQIEDLSQQNSNLLSELNDVKKALQQGQNSQSQQNQQSSSGQQSDQMPKLAKDLKQLKDMVNQLEKKMNEYVQKQVSGGTLTHEDVVQLLLTMMDGMIDWATDMVKNAGKSQNGGGNASSNQGGAGDSSGNGGIQLQ